MDMKYVAIFAAVAFVLVFAAIKTTAFASTEQGAISVAPASGTCSGDGSCCGGDCGSCCSGGTCSKTGATSTTGGCGCK